VVLYHESEAPALKGGRGQSVGVAGGFQGKDVDRISRSQAFVFVWMTEEGARRHSFVHPGVRLMTGVGVL
jgi:hypothetical protein